MAVQSNFIDYVKICCRSGAGGSGSAHFLRDKWTSKGGPDGGDGGRGGHIVVRGNEQMWTLLHLKYKKHVIATNGQPGGGSRSSGAEGEDIILDVPLGTIVRDVETGAVEFEITEHGQTKIVTPGGKGGRGNCACAVRFTLALLHSQRDNYQMEIAAIEQANRKEQEDFEEQMATLDGLLENELQLESAAQSGTNGTEQTDVGLCPVARCPRPDPGSFDPGLGKASGPGKSDTYGDMAIEDEATLKKKVGHSIPCGTPPSAFKAPPILEVNKGAWGIAKEKADVQVCIRVLRIHARAEACAGISPL